MPLLKYILSQCGFFAAPKSSRLWLGHTEQYDGNVIIMKSFNAG